MMLTLRILTVLVLDIMDLLAAMLCGSKRLTKNDFILPFIGIAIVMNLVRPQHEARICPTGDQAPAPEG